MIKMLCRKKSALTPEEKEQEMTKLRHLCAIHYLTFYALVMFGWLAGCLFGGVLLEHLVGTSLAVVAASILFLLVAALTLCWILLRFRLAKWARICNDSSARGEVRRATMEKIHARQAPFVHWWWIYLGANPGDELEKLALEKMRKQAFQDYDAEAWKIVREQAPEGSKLYGESDEAIAICGYL